MYNSWSYFSYDTQRFKDKLLLSLQEKKTFACTIFSKIHYVACTINRTDKLICLHTCLHELNHAGLNDKPVKQDKKDRIMQRVSNLMFIFIGLIYLAILTHHHYNNIHNNIDNNINNTVSATHSQKRIFLLPTPTEAALYTILYHTLQAIYIIQKQSRLYPIFFYSGKKVCGEAFHHWCW